MNDVSNESLRQVLTLVLASGALYLLWSWVAQRGRRPVPPPAEARVTVYCKHCNWEGPVRRATMQCARCRSQNLGVISI